MTGKADLQRCPFLFIGLAFMCLGFACPQASLTQDTATATSPLHITRDSTANGDVSRGYYEVFENRQSRTGRTIKLNLVVLHARHSNPQPDPVFVMAGGPGQAAARIAGEFANHWIRADRDIVLLSQRGTDLDNELSFRKIDPENSLQQYLRPFIMEDSVRENLARLEKTADLRMYSTPMAMDDVNEVRQALGYDKINLMGASYGTRASLVYIRRHGDSVRTAMLDGCAPIEFRNPLHHAEGAQMALNRLLDEVESNARYRQAFPDLRNRFYQVLARLEENGPVRIKIRNRGTGRIEIISMDREAFVDALRYQMYYLDSCRRVPLLIEKAWHGDFRPFVLGSIDQKKALDDSIATGMLMCVTAAEDVARIDPDEIAGATGDSFMGPGRVQRQMAAAKIWPRSDLPADYAEPVNSEVPVLIFSGILDPVTPPKWGQMVADNFPNSLHIVAPSAHGVHGNCADSLRRQFLNSGTVMGLDTSCISQMKLPPLVLPGR